MEKSTSPIFQIDKGKDASTKEKDENLILSK